MGIAVFEEEIFWTNTDSEDSYHLSSIRSANKFLIHDDDGRILQNALHDVPSEMTIYHGVFQIEGTSNRRWQQIVKVVAVVENVCNAEFSF